MLLRHCVKRQWTQEAQEEAVLFIIMTLVIPSLVGRAYAGVVAQTQEHAIPVPEEPAIARNAEDPAAARDTRGHNHGQNILLLAFGYIVDFLSRVVADMSTPQPLPVQTRISVCPAI